MRILFLTNYYPPHEVGGYEQLCRDVALCLAERGHTIAVLTSDRGVESGESTHEPGIHRLLRIQPEPNRRLGMAAQFFLTRRRVEAYNRQACQDAIRQVQPDVVFVWNLQGLPHELALEAESCSGVAVAYWLAGYTPAEPDSFWRYWAQPPGKNVFLKGVKGALSRLALAQMRREGKPVRPQMRHVAVVSEYMRGKGLSENTLPAHTEVIYNGVETESFYHPVPSPDAPPPVNLLLAGRVSADKGVHVAVQAVGALAQSRPQRDFRLVIAGGGPVDYREQLQQSAATHGVEDLVSFTGWLPREQMPGLMHRCHVLLLTSIYPEAFARVTLEGMAAGLTVVGTLVGGTGELLHDGDNGLVSAVEDAQDLARQIGRLLDDPHLRHRLASRGQEMVMEQYTLECMVARVENLLQRAITEQNA
jgi:glycosyltransferase involved in cell wall biosynthesis